MGYSGHGAQIATHIGVKSSPMPDPRSRPDRNPLEPSSPGPAIPGHLGQPWFLPLVGAYYKFKAPDRVGRSDQVEH